MAFEELKKAAVEVVASSHKRNGTKDGEVIVDEQAVMRLATELAKLRRPAT